MAKRKTATQRLAEAVAELGIEKAAEYFDFLKALKKPEPKPRKAKSAATGTTGGKGTGTLATSGSS